MRTFRIGARGSALARRQAQIVQEQLAQRIRGIACEQVVISSRADERPETPLADMAGEGIFVKELESALLDGRIDLAVHSLKDVPLETPAPLCLAAVLAREEPRDALISRTGARFAQLPQGARVGTSSVRRRSQLLLARSDVQMQEIRGNVDTRLRKLDEGRYDAIVLAACGLIRLGWAHRITECLEPSLMLPEPGQGVLAVETRADDAETLRMVAELEDAESRACIDAERAFLRELGGGCRVPIAAYATLRGATLELDGAVVAADGSARLRERMSGSRTEAAVVGARLAGRLIAQGAKNLLSPTSSSSSTLL